MALQWFGKPARGMIDRQAATRCRSPATAFSTCRATIASGGRTPSTGRSFGTTSSRANCAESTRRATEATCARTTRRCSSQCAIAPTAWLPYWWTAPSFPVIAGGVANWGYIANDGDPFSAVVSRPSEYTKFKGTPYWYDSTKYTGHGQDLQLTTCSPSTSGPAEKNGSTVAEKLSNSASLSAADLLRRVQLVENPERANQPNRLQQLWSSLRLVALNQKNGAKVWSKSITINSGLPCRVFPHAGRGSFNPQLHHHEVLRGRLLHP